MTGRIHTKRPRDPMGLARAPVSRAPEVHPQRAEVAASARAGAGGEVRQPAVYDAGCRTNTAEPVSVEPTPGGLS